MINKISRLFLVAAMIMPLSSSCSQGQTPSVAVVADAAARNLLTGVTVLGGLFALTYVAEGYIGLFESQSQAPKISEKKFKRSVKRLRNLYERGCDKVAMHPAFRQRFLNFTCEVLPAQRLNIKDLRQSYKGLEEAMPLRSNSSNGSSAYESAIASASSK